MFSIDFGFTLCYNTIVVNRGNVWDKERRNMEKVKKFIKELFGARTDATKYGTVIVNFLIGISLPAVALGLMCLIPVSSPFRKLIAIPFFLIWIMLFAFFGRLIAVSDNKTAKAIKENRYKFKYDPMDLTLDDFVYWLTNANMIDEILVRSQEGINYLFTIRFDHDRKGNVLSKSFFLDDREIASPEDCVKLFKELGIIQDDVIKVYQYIDGSDPRGLYEYIKFLKETNHDIDDSSNLTF